MSETPDNVVTSADVAQKKVPTSFRDLRKAELVDAARSFGTLEEGNAEEIRADLADAGVTWEMYKKAFGLESDTTVEAVVEEPVLEDEGVEEVTDVVTADPNPVLARQDKYLIKMTRKNPYFEFGRYKFTQDKPYAIMNANDAQRILESEDGFRQAYPAELQEFYS